MKTPRALPAPSATSRTASNRRSFALAGAALASFALLACAPKYYSANSQNVPLLTAEGEGSVSAAVNTNWNSADFRGAYALTDNLALQGNAAFYFPRDEDSTGDGGSGGLFEAGAGYFRPLPHNLVFETYGLLAYGGLENHFPSAANDNPGTTGKLSANLMRVAVQPALGWKIPYFEAALSARAAMLQYFRVTGNLVTGDGDQQEYLRDNSLQFLIEPALTLRGGADRIKAEFQVGVSANLTDKDFPQDKNWGSLGLIYSFK
jgi:hypothetical protein